MNIIIQEIKMSLKSLFFWAFGSCFFIAMAGIEFSTYYGNSKINELMAVMPESMRDAFGMGGADLSTVTGYIGMMFTFTLVIVAFHAATVGSGLLSSEFRNKTSDFVLSLPVSRSKLLINKIIGGVVVCTLMLLITNVAMLVLVFSFDYETNFTEFYLYGMLAHYILQMLFLSIGVLASTLFKNPKKSGNFVLSMLGLMYFMQLMQPMHKSLEFLKYLTPFKFFDPTTIMNDLSLPLYPLILVPIVVVISIVISFIKFEQRDITY
jgi:ABC-2 type transport system permease protein